MRVAELKAITKERGLRGYSRLRKAELIALLRDNFQPSTRPPPMPAPRPPPATRTRPEGPARGGHQGLLDLLPYLHRKRNWLGLDQIDQDSQKC